MKTEAARGLYLSTLTQTNNRKNGSGGREPQLSSFHPQHDRREGFQVYSSDIIDQSLYTYSEIWIDASENLQSSDPRCLDGDDSQVYGERNVILENLEICFQESYQRRDFFQHYCGIIFKVPDQREGRKVIKLCICIM